MRPLCLGLVLSVLAGCSVAQQPAPLPQSVRPKVPYVIHIPGIGGICDIDETLRDGLVQGGFGNVELFDWTCNDPGIPALHARTRQREQSKRLAAKIIDHLRSNPDQPIYLTSHSGGAGIVAWALEDLPPGVQVENWVMLAPALSPDFDLSRALSHIHGRAFCFYSAKDNVVLGSGTKLLGTIDGKRVEAAGYLGFKMPPGAVTAEYHKLTQIPYDPEWQRLGNTGGHMGCMATPFARAVVAPVMAGRKPTEADYQAAGTAPPVPEVRWPWVPQ